MDLSDRLLNSVEAAGRLGVERSLLYKLAADGVIACVRLGRALRFRESDIDALLDAAYCPPRPGAIGSATRPAPSDEVRPLPDRPPRFRRVNP